MNCKYRTDLSRFQNMDWNEVMDIASIQGVLGVCLDGLTSILSILPDDQNIGLSLDQKMEWIGQVSLMESSYGQHSHILKSVCEDLHDLKILLLKDIGLSFYYPTPNLRPVVGDIDIYTYTYGQHETVDTNFRRCGANPKRSVEKYMVAVLDGVVFENHYIYVDSYVSNAEKKTQQYIESLDNDIKTPYSYYTPSAIKNYYFSNSYC